MFYNTGISTYVWILSNKKPTDRKGWVQLIDASSFWQKMRTSLGSSCKEFIFPAMRLEEGIMCFSVQPFIMYTTATGISCWVSPRQTVSGWLHRYQQRFL